jgi:hypothetical protein
MCNDYEQHVRWAEYCKMMQALELGIPSQQSELDLRQADDIRINDTGPVMRGAGNEIELVRRDASGVVRTCAAWERRALLRMN